MKKTITFLILIALCKVILAQSVVDITDLNGQISSQHSDSPTNEDINKLIDNSSYSKFLTFNNATWVQFSTDNSYVINEYAITSGNDAPERDPLNWQLKGSNDGINWQTIDSRTSEDFINRRQRRAFAVVTNKAFSQYRLYLENNSGNILQLSEFELLGEEAIVVPLEDITELGGTISAQHTDSPNNETIDKLTDNNENSKFLTFNSSAWIQYHNSTAYAVKSFTLTSANDAPERDPASIVLKGSNDGVNFMGLSTTNNVTFSSRYEKRTFNVNNSTAYNYYRLYLTNVSGNILQVAEMELFAGEISTKKPIANFTINKTTAKVGENIVLTNTSTNATSYNWTFDGAQVIASSDASATIKYNAVGVYSVVLAASNSITSNTKTVSITITEDNNTGDWSSFIYPNVIINNTAGNHPGVSKYTALCQANGFNGIEDFVQHCCLVIAKKLYYTVEEANAHGLRTVTYKLNDGGSLSYKGGAPPHIEIGFDVNHIVTFANNYGDAAATDEVYGVLCHELVHGYQNEPKNCGQYDGNSEFYGFIEGTADLGRLMTGGFNPERFPSTGGSWKNGYTTTAFFYQWLVNTKNKPNFLLDINKSAGEYSTWSHEAFFQNYFGVGVQTLWNEYQNSISQRTSDQAKKSFSKESKDITHGIEFTEIELYPNPVSTVLNINTPISDKKLVLSVYNISGVMVKQITIEHQTTSLDVSDLSNGMYFIRNNQNTNVKKFIRGN